MITHLGELSIGSIVLILPDVLAILTGASAPVGDLYKDLVTRINANIQMGVALANPAVVAAQVAAAISALPATIAQIIASSVPNLNKARLDYSADAAALAGVSLGLKNMVGLLGGVLGAGGLHLYRYDGAVSAMASELGSEIGGGLVGGSGPAGNANALVIVTESPAAWEFLRKVFLT